MMVLNPYAEAQKIWKKITKDSSIPELEFELEVHKRLLNIFQVGDYYYYIFNCAQGEFEYMQENVQAVLGYQPQDCTVPMIMDIIHPEDLPFFLNFEGAVTDFFNQLPVEKRLKYKVRYDYRIRKADGRYLRILQQVVTIQLDSAGGVLRMLGVHTDISHLKQEGTPVLSFIGLEGEPSYVDVKPKTLFAASRKVLSTREKEILALLIGGHASQQIGQKLHISPHTVNTHRKNILAKTGAGNTSELVARAVKEGWV